MYKALLLTFIPVFLAALIFSASTRADDSADLPPGTTHSSQPHELQFLPTGAASFEKRLELIAHAQHSLSIEAFEFKSEDAVGRALLEAILKRKDELKKQGKNFDVRILVDYGPWSGTAELKPALARELAEHGIEVRYFNDASFPLNKTYRDHHKEWIADGQSVIDGSRNIADSFFGLDPYKNYVDRDLEINGPIAQAAQAGFDHFWNSKYSSLPDKTDTTGPGLDATLADGAWKVSTEKLRNQGIKDLARYPKVQCDDLTFVTDRPELRKDAHQVAGEFHQWLSHAKNSVLMENYTFLPTPAQEKVFDDLFTRTHVEVLTNGTHSVGGFYNTNLWELSFARQKRAVEKGADVYDFNGAVPLYWTNTREQPDAYPMGIHSKTVVIDHQDTWLGTNNVDPRSEGINFEDGYSCNHQPDLAAQVESVTREDIMNAEQVMANGLYRNVDADGNTMDCLPIERFESTEPIDERFSNRLIHQFYRIRDAIFEGQF